jgi:hypothetical protein
MPATQNYGTGLGLLFLTWPLFRRRRARLDLEDHTLAIFPRIDRHNRLGR